MPPGYRDPSPGPQQPGRQLPLRHPTPVPQARLSSPGPGHTFPTPLPTPTLLSGQLSGTRPRSAQRYPGLCSCAVLSAGSAPAHFLRGRLRLSPHQVPPGPRAKRNGVPKSCGIAAVSRVVSPLLSLPGLGLALVSFEGFGPRRSCDHPPDSVCFCARCS